MLTPALVSDGSVPAAGTSAREEGTVRICSWFVFSGGSGSSAAGVGFQDVQFREDSPGGKPLSSGRCGRLYGGSCEQKYALVLFNQTLVRFLPCSGSIFILVMLFLFQYSKISMAIISVRLGGADAGQWKWGQGRCGTAGREVAGPGNKMMGNWYNAMVQPSSRCFLRHRAGRFRIKYQSLCLHLVIA
jgi:hypothetical protein